MKVKTPILILIALLATFAQAATVALTPSSIYETTKVWEALDVNNYKGSSIITRVEVSSPSLAINNADTYSGWATTYDSDSAEWTNGTIETNVKSAVFEFEVTAPNVTNDTTMTLTARLNSASTTLNLTILNDATPPNITDIKPSGYARANNPAQPISAKVTDAETGVASVQYYYNDCSGGQTTYVSLTKSNDTYSGTADFTNNNEGSRVCYTITARNNAGETATTTGQLLFDGTAPTVTIVSPTSFATETTDFKFNASDNIATTLSCTLSLGTSTLATVTAANGTTTTSTQNLTGYSEGSQTWSVTCADGVGLTATHAQAIILDTTPPSVSVNVNSAIPRTQTEQFTATITDTVSVASVTATYDGNPVNLTKNGNAYTGTISSSTLGTKTLTITANDDAGHTTTSTTTITIVPNHQITLSLSPDQTTPGTTITASGTLTTDGSTTSNSITVKTPTGDINTTLVNNAYSVTFTAPSDGTYTITTEYPEAGYTYTAQATLTVSSGGQQQLSGSSGYDSDWDGSPGYVKPGEEPQESGGSNAVIPNESIQEQTPPADYQPLPAEEPREALTPKTTGVFTLGKTIKWLSLLAALALLIAMGVYAYKKRPPKEQGVNWDGYFEE